MTHGDLDRMREAFHSVSQTVGNVLSSVCPQVVAVVAKWNPQDLVPGLSDLDFRIICDDGTTAEDWVLVDRVCGENHLAMVREHPEWNRINEHTPGAGITIVESLDQRFHNPEYQNWSLWWGRGDWLDSLKTQMMRRPFGASDEQVHLSNFLNYYSAYVHGIDPPINLGDRAEKYAVHSRCWHYFAPPMVAAASILARRNFNGKRDALGWLHQHGYAVRQIEAVLEQVDVHYETSLLGDSAKLADFERFLLKAFDELWPHLLNSLNHFDFDRTMPRSHVKQHLSERAAQPLEVLMESIRFARIRAGRFYFYLNAPNYFDTKELLRREVAWMKKFTAPVFLALGVILENTSLAPFECLAQLNVRLSATEKRALDFVLDLAECSKDEPGLSERFRRAVNEYPHYYRVIDSALQAATDVAPVLTRT